MASPTLSDYITETRRLLHDATAVFYTDAQITDYVNDARERVVRDTGCLRTIQNSVVNNGQEVYDYATDLPDGTRTLDIININLYWGNTRIPLRYMSWTQFNAELRFWMNYVGRPIAFTSYGQQKFYISPTPDQEYVIEVDTIVLPEPLVNDSDVDTIIYPYTSPVAFYAAYKAKYYEQSYGEAEIFKQEYSKQLQAVLTSVFTRRMPNPYSTVY
jgi:hypothetical protein